MKKSLLVSDVGFESVSEGNDFTELLWRTRARHSHKQLSSASHVWLVRLHLQLAFLLLCMATLRLKRS